MEFWIFGGLSALTVIAGAVWVLRIAPKKRDLFLSLSALSQFTIAVFAATVLMYIPVYYHWDVWRDDYAFLRPLLLAIVGAMRTFILDADFDIIEQTVPTAPKLLRVLFCLYAAGIFFTAPVLTFTNVLSMFRNFTGEIRLRMSSRKPIYIMSELNLQSVTMAEQIADKYTGKKTKAPRIVFAEVFAQNEEKDYELIRRARMLNAICLKKDVAHIDFASKGEPVEIFLLGKNETENTSQAISLTEKYRSCRRSVSVFVYSTEGYTDYILDALEKGDQLLHENILRRIEENPGEFLYEDKWMQQDFPVNGRFCLRRVDLVDTLAMEVLTHEQYADYRAIYDAAREDKTISLTVLGMGRYGSHFLKTAVWFYQRCGYRVECNVIELGKENGDPEKRFRQECPELLDYAYSNEPDEAQHHIRFFNEIDCLGSDFDRLILEQEADRFLKTKLVFIALGDDDRNINAAMNIRSLFDKLLISRGQTPGTMPYIYAVVYDDRKVSNLDADRFRKLRNHKGEDLYLRFISTLATQYSYDVIERSRMQEKAAFKYHLDWTRKETQLRTCYEDAVNQYTARPDYAACLAFRKELDEEQETEDIRWGDSQYFYEKTLASGKKAVDYNGPINTLALKATAEQYVRYAYCRKSSVAKARHKEALAACRDVAAPHSGICVCDDCKTARITEHMRWNAYMRSLGYRYSSYTGGNHYRAKLHCDLLPWKMLPCRERYKD